MMQKLTRIYADFKPPVIVWLVLMAIAFLILSGCYTTSSEVFPEIKAWQPPIVSTEGIPLAAVEPDPDGVRLVQVGIAADGPMIMVSFQGPSDLVHRWNQGSIYVIDEKRGVKYDQITTAPVLGPLFNKPKEDGRIGFVMLNNYDSNLKVGSSVTAILGKYKRIQVTVK
jgi:hypothetical protein